MPVHISTHPLIQAKLSQLRSNSTASRDVRTLVGEISTMLGVEALSSLAFEAPGKPDTTPQGKPYTTTEINTTKIAITPILRAGLGMADAIANLFPTPPPVYHLGIFREKVSLQPVEYYSKLPSNQVPDTAILVDPTIATGGTVQAAMAMLKDWGVKHIIVLAVLASQVGTKHLMDDFPDVELWAAGGDEELTADGMLSPGFGDIGDRLFNTGTK